MINKKVIILSIMFLCVVALFKFLSKTNDKFKRPKTEEEELEEQAKQAKQTNTEDFTIHTIAPYNY
jgi:Tfp pilus assembly protein PilO